MGWDKNFSILIIIILMIIIFQGKGKQQWWINKAQEKQVTQMQTAAHHQTTDAQLVPKLQQCCYVSLLSNATEQGINSFAAKN